MLEDYDVVETIYHKQSFPEYYATLYAFADGLDANEAYNTDRPGHLPSGARFREHVANMKELGVGADRGDSLLKERRQAVRDLSELEMDACVSYVRGIAIFKKEPAILLTLGLPQKVTHQKNSHKVVSPLAVDITVRLKHVKGETGAILIEGTHVRNGGPYLINICKGEPISEDSWYNPGGHHNSCGRIIMRGLEPANKYYIRMRTDGPEGPGNWSHPVWIIVL
jgi:hypothetical protein